MNNIEKAPRILVVEDEDGIRKSICMVLAKNGYDVHQARDGAEGKEILLEDQDFDVIILDIKMPRIDGIKLLSWIASERLVTSVIMLSALAEMEVAASTVRVGAFDYLTKPVTREDLLDSVKKAVANTEGLRSPVFE